MLQVPEDYQMPKLGKSTSRRLSDEEFMHGQLITLRDMEGKVIAKDITREEAKKIVRQRYEAQSQGYCSL